MTSLEMRMFREALDLATEALDLATEYVQAHKEASTVAIALSKKTIEHLEYIIASMKKMEAKGGA